ncbi:YheT family hydrolase [Pelistega sp. MC2]|uniref:YheT family hydrolase n=1 Tax=Pelistega sp. MC2 TaxID=1720297 RepID=UPI0008D9F274|nr:alpha/beta fold hydrolase [Pelistega sp. MC2]
MSGQLDTSEFNHPFWLPEGQSQTIIGSKFATYAKITFARERIRTPDQDFIDLDWHIPHTANQDYLDAPAPAIPHFTGKALLFFHGLEGSSQSHYAQSICHDFRALGWAVVVAHFRGCSGEANLLARSYFSGDIQDVETVMQAVKNRLPHAQWYAAGFSMGGNVLLKYAGARGAELASFNAIASISAPTDLYATGLQLGKGFFGKYVYTPYFLTTMKKKMQQKHKAFPGSIEITRLAKAKTLKDFDDIYTGPIHGFRNAEDYWKKCSSKPDLIHILVPTLILNAKNDPFIPRESLPTIEQVSDVVTLHQPEHGGHVGFSQGTFPSRLGWLSQRLWQFFQGY